MEKKSLAFKLNISISILLLFILCSSIYTIIMIERSQKYADNTGSNWLPSLNSISAANIIFANLSRRELRALLEKDANEKVKYLKEIEEFREKIKDWIKNYQSLINDSTEKKEFQEVEKNLQEYLIINEKTVEFIKAGEEKKAFENLNIVGKPVVYSTEKALNKLSDYNYKGGINSTKQGNYLTTLTKTTMMIIIISGLLVAAAIFKLIINSTQSIANAVVNLKKQSIATSEIANNLKKGAGALNDSVGEQAASVHETTAAINEITSMVNRTAENAKESTSVAKTTSDKAEAGQKTMHRLVQAMETIQESNSQLQNIAVIINQINTKTAVINDIVTKTELLSLNASIESARAGEYGKGFAVVAEEVGNLAKISGKSAHEIQALISKSQEEVNKILEITKNRVNEGKTVSEEAQSSFQNIAEDINIMSGVIQQISDATHEQEIGVRQISTAMNQIDKATQNSQMAVNTTADSSKQLVEQSDKLDITAKDIEILIMGKTS
ncbi:HAMP domain-containing methyl-accepting chemotaxis protein [Fluviispira multicolorata]|uniref:Methyl-accepting transducer domain-containing protein n=1 Tax=Fluviispira multicolorata TaxID=2654512 RepID=A0A833JDX6_9BACT|nr:methyl-accepting chemotaxis protein [Fluviispira multicolorata]KAB8032024.1 hypothetical protein GCL57_05085 [Fluviispira multicolorata]